MFNCFFIYILFITSFVCAKSENAHLHVVAGKVAKMPLLIVVFETDPAFNKELVSITEVLQKDFSFSGQFDVVTKQLKGVPSKDAIRAFSKEGFLLGVFLTINAKSNDIEWRVYDLSTADLIMGKRYVKRGELVRGWAHAIADRVWPVLTGQDPFFSTKIAYCRVATSKKGKRLQHIYVADFDGSYPEPLVKLPTISVAPVWNQDVNMPRLWYSEYGNTNVRLMMIDMNKKRTVVASDDGITMLPAFCKKNNMVVYCASGGTGHCQLFCYKKGSLSALTHSTKNSMSPVFGFDEDSLYFCSDDGGRPQICHLSLKNNQLTPITHGGFCTAPAYCKKRRSLAYCKMVKGTMQIFLYDELEKQHIQLTHDIGNKGECSWSPCGNYLIYGVSQTGKNRIGMLNLVTNKQHFITPADQQCSYPAWSPLYSCTPVVTE